jgi:hypothetical protein
MTETATSKLPDEPTQAQLQEAADVDGVAAFRSETDPAVSPVVAHREAFAPGGEYGPKAAKRETPAKKTAPAAPARKRAASKRTGKQ